MQFTANGKGEIVLHKCCTQHGKLTCTVMTVILKMMGRKYRAYMSKRAAWRLLTACNMPVITIKIIMMIIITITSTIVTTIQELSSS